MSGNVSKPIITDGLITYLDAANTDSYSGNGTVWNDLRGNSINGILYNGVGFNSNNRRSMILDGTNDYIKFSNSSKLDLNTFSYSCWYYPTAYNQYNTIFSREYSRHYLLFNSAGRYIIFLRGNNYVAGGSFESSIGSNGLASLNNWSYVTVNIDWPNGTFSVYHNTSLVWSLTNTNLGTSFLFPNLENSTIGNRYNGTGSQRFIGNINYFKYYNRILSQSEILQNYNSTKGKFGL